VIAILKIATCRLDHTPFKKFQDHEVQLRKYINPVIRLVSMFLHKCPVPLTPEIDNIIQKLHTSLSPRHTLKEVSDLVFQLLCTIWCQEWLPILCHRIHDPTMVYLAFSSLEEQGTFKDAKSFTGIIAQFKYCICLALFALMHRDGADLEGSFQHHQYWLQEKNECTFQSLCTAQHVASSIAYNTMSLPSIWWTDREHFQSMLVKGTPLAFQEIQAMLRSLETDIQSAWEKDVMLNLPLQANYDLLHDNLTSRRLSYSFTTDEQNKMFVSHRETLV